MDTHVACQLPGRPVFGSPRRRGAAAAFPATPCGFLSSETSRGREETSAEDGRRLALRLAMNPHFRSQLAGTLIALATATVACDSPTAPTATPLPLQRETAGMRYYYAAGDTIDVDWQEAYNAWVIDRIGVRPPQPIEYYKYRSRADMGDHIGVSTTNGYSEPGVFRIHSIWPTDNHEVVHVLSALIGRPSDFFNEGFAVSLQTDPKGGNFNVRFNGMQVHDACRDYRMSGALPGPLVDYVTTNKFRSIQDSTMSYRMAGSFMLHLTERFGLPSVLQFLRGDGPNESLATIQARMRSVFGVSLEEAESSWVQMLAAR